MINAELQEICNWFQVSKLPVNAGKKNYMVLGTHHNTRNFIDINQDIGGHLPQLLATTIQERGSI